MPGKDGTGPNGKGPFTGKAMGDCILKIDSNEMSDIEKFRWNCNRKMHNRYHGAGKLMVNCTRKSWRKKGKRVDGLISVYEGY